MQEKITLQLTLPLEYPTGANPVVTFTAPSLSKANHHALQTNLNDFLSSQSSSTEERLLEIVQSFIDRIPSQSSPIPAVETSEATQSASNKHQLHCSDMVSSSSIHNETESDSGTTITSRDLKTRIPWNSCPTRSQGYPRRCNYRIERNEMASNASSSRN